MAIPVSQIMTEIVKTLDTEYTVEKVQAIFSSDKLSSAPVVDSKGAIFGIISALDLLHFQAEKKNPKSIKAWELCTYKPLAVNPQTPVVEVAELMLKHRIHHVLIAENNKLLGIISAFDFIKLYVQENPSKQLT